ncbi:hypothetical protein OQA88_4853 [Cercophora sp. LCS_1]
MSVLIAIATAHNTTTDIAHRVAARLRTHVTGPVDVLNISDIPADTLPQYKAVVIGSAIHAGSWLSPARKFIQKEQKVLSGRPVWAYSVGVPGNEKYKEDERVKIEKEVRKCVPALKGHVLFEGRVERDHLPWPVNKIFSLFPNVWRFGDFVQWDLVEGWADEVGQAMEGL